MQGHGKIRRLVRHTFQSIELYETKHRRSSRRSRTREDWRLSCTNSRAQRGFRAAVKIKCSPMRCMHSESSVTSHRCSPTGWLWGSFCLPVCWGEKGLAGAWYRQLRTTGLHQRQEAVCVHPRLCLQWLDHQQHQEVYLWKQQNQLKLRSWQRCEPLFICSLSPSLHISLSVTNLYYLISCVMILMIFLLIFDIFIVNMCNNYLKEIMENMSNNWIHYNKSMNFQTEGVKLMQLFYCLFCVKMYLLYEFNRSN